MNPTIQTMRHFVLKAVLILCVFISNTRAGETLFDHSECYSAEGATFSSVLLSFKNEEKSEKINVSNGNNSIAFRVYSPKSPENKGDWVLVFAGIGSSADSAHGKKAVNVLRKAGVKSGLIIVPSVFREKFANSFSSVGIVGNIPEDAKDLNNALLLLKEKISKNGMAVRKVSYFGFSLGALTAAHLAYHVDNMDMALKPEKVILMNSPIDLLGSLRNIDRLYLQKASVIETSKIAYTYLNNLKKYPSQENMEKLLCSLQDIGPVALSGTIAETLKFGLDQIFLQGQERNPTGALDTRRRSYIRSRRDQERLSRLRNRRRASNLTFEGYVESSVFPASNSSMISDLNKSVSITSLADYLKDNPKAYLIHTEDDFLQSNDEELREYSSYFLPSNTWITKTGGHLGLLNSLEFGKKVKSFLERD